MGYSVRILHEAEHEYQQIVEYLAITLGNRKAAQDFMDEFDRQVEFLREHPQMRPVSHLPELAARGYRAAPVGRYLFLYTFDGQMVTIAHLFHQAQDYAALI